MQCCITEKTIQEIENIDPYSAGSVTELKDTYLGVKPKITGNKTVVVELQVLNAAKESNRESKGIKLRGK